MLSWALRLVRAPAPAWLSAPPLSASAARCALISAGTFVLCAAVAALHPRSAGLRTRSYTVSTLHSIVVVLLALAVYDEAAATGSLWDASGAVWSRASPGVEAPIAVTLGYILFDVALALVAPRGYELLTPAMRLHHAVVCASLSAALACNVGAVYVALFLIHEASTVPLNLHVEFGAAWKARRPRCRTANGACLWLTYAVARVGLTAVLWASIAVTSAPPVRGAVWAMHLLVLATLSLLNLYWFSQITRGLLKALRGAADEGGGAKVEAAEGRRKNE